eukprot:4213120-Pleurochrysis_carterae.AAC.1
MGLHDGVNSKWHLTSNLPCLWQSQHFQAPENSATLAIQVYVQSRTEGVVKQAAEYAAVQQAKRAPCPMRSARSDRREQRDFRRRGVMAT